MEAGLQYIATGLMVGGIYGLIALAIVLIYKATGIFNFAVGNLMALGAFICWNLWSVGINIWISIAISVLILS